MAEFSLGESLFCYRITGKQSVERLVPLVTALIPTAQNVDVQYLKNDSTKLDFVWETTCEKDLKSVHHGAKIYNKLNNSQIIESKASFAALQLLIDFPMLETRVASSAAIVALWAQRRWKETTTIGLHTSKDWWVVKASRGNGGRDIWVLNKENYEEVVLQLPEKDEYVIQR